jgi:AcrR family transcriptional regulator
MGRKAKYTDVQFLDAARDLAAGKGPEAVTIAGIADAVGAPIGSVYHRFPSRELLMARLWLRTVRSFQEGFLEILARGEAGPTALYTPRWVREHFNEALLLLVYRREEFFGDAWPEEIRDDARILMRLLDEGIIDFTIARFNRVSEEVLQRTVFALIDVPYAAVRRYLQQGAPPPVFVDDMIEQTCRIIMGDDDENT